MVNLIQVVLTVFIIFALSRVVLRLRDKQINIVQFLIWCTAWVAVGILVLLPDTTVMLARLFGVGRGVDAIIYISIALLFYLVFRIYVKLDMTEQEITKLVRETSIRKALRKGGKR